MALDPPRAAFFAPPPDDRPRAAPAFGPADLAPDFREAALFPAPADFLAPDDFFAVPPAFRVLDLLAALRPELADFAVEALLPALFVAAGLLPDAPVPRVTGLRGVGVCVAGREMPPDPLLELRGPVAPPEKLPVDPPPTGDPPDRAGPEGLDPPGLPDPAGADPPGRPDPDAVEGLELALPVPPASVEIGC